MILDMLDIIFWQRMGIGVFVIGRWLRLDWMYRNCMVGIGDLNYWMVTTMSDLSSKSLQICKRNYKDNCGKCPIRGACVAPVKCGYSGLDEWIEGVNLLAEGVE
jgi:hypothetical protein